MRRSTLLVWAPRILGFLMVLFLSLFALDVFGEGLGFWRTLLALAMHLIPAGIAAAVLAIAWRWSAAGGALFVLAGVACAIVATAIAVSAPDSTLPSTVGRRGVRFACQSLSDRRMDSFPRGQKV